MPLRAISCILLATCFFSVQDALFKQLSEHYEVLQLLLVRMSMVICILFMVFWLRRGKLSLRTRRLAPMLLRGVIAYVAFFMYYIALQRIPMAEGATIFMTAPLFVTALSVPLLGERVGVHRWLAVCIGFLAIVVMLRPGTELFQPISILVVLVALLYALIPILTRFINSAEQAFTITFYTALSYWCVCVLAGLVVHRYPASPNDSGVWATIAQPWPPIAALDVATIAVTAILFSVSILLITTAYRLANVSVIVSFEYSYLVWATLMGYLFFGDVPAHLTWAAGAVIAASGVYIAFREHRLQLGKSAHC